MACSQMFCEPIFEGHFNARYSLQVPSIGVAILAQHKKTAQLA